ncbi:MAG: hypothetical protein LBK06_04575 [Planctomycetaceae bacterium]|nr:hypothetical protein [Planctomycetaceae bacterium]
MYRKRRDIVTKNYRITITSSSVAKKDIYAKAVLKFTKLLNTVAQQRGAV